MGPLSPYNSTSVQEHNCLGCTVCVFSSAGFAIGGQKVIFLECIKLKHSNMESESFLSREFQKENKNKTVTALGGARLLFLLAHK